MSHKQLGKGGKIVQKKKEESGPAIAIERNSRCIERLQEEMVANKTCCEEPHARILSIVGVGPDGQFRVEVERKRLIRQDEILIVQSTTTESVVPGRFLKNAGKKNAKLTCPELIRVGSVVALFTAKGCGSVQVARADKFCPSYSSATYTEIDYILTEEKEAEWVALGIAQITVSETKKLIAENATVPEEKRKPAMLSLQQWSKNFQTFLSAVNTPL